LAGARSFRFLVADDHPLFRDALKQIVAENDHLEDKVMAAFTEYGDFSMNVLFIYYIKKDSDILESQTEVNLAVLRRFTEAGLEFAFPTQTIHTVGAGVAGAA